MGGTSSTDWLGRTLVSRYEVKRRLAKGGMGTVYAARDRHLGRTVVIKVPRRDLLANRRRRDLFLREIEDLKRFDQPHVVRILDKGEHEGMPFAVLQYCEGGSLEDRLRAAPDQRLDPAAVLSWLRDIAGALDVIHARGVVHRDVKPANILFDNRGEVYLSDFGVAKSYSIDGSRATGLAGSPAYMAPEQALGTKLAGTTDQYSLAVTVYRALAGEVPFREKAVFALLARKQRGKPRDLRQVAPDLRRSVAAVVMQAMSRDAADRYPSCTAFADAFEAAVRKPHRVRVATRRARRRGTPWLWTAAVAALATLPLLAMRLRSRHEERMKTTAVSQHPDSPPVGTSRPEPPREAAVPLLPLRLHVDEPRAGAFLARRNVRVAGSIEGWERGATLMVGGARIPVQGARFETWVDAGTEDGPFALVVRLERAGEEQISVERDVVIDTASPVLELPDALTTDHTVAGRIVDANPQWVRIDGEDIPLAPDGTFHHSVGFGSRITVPLVFEARDLAGNEFRLERRYRRRDTRLALDPPFEASGTHVVDAREIVLQGRVEGPDHPWRVHLSVYAASTDPSGLRAVPGARASIGVDREGAFEQRFTVEEDGPCRLVVDLYSEDGFRIDKASVGCVVDTVAPRFREILTEREKGTSRGVVIRGMIFDESPVSLTCNGAEVRVGLTGTFTVRLQAGVEEAGLVIRDAAGHEARRVVDLRELR